VSAGQAGLPASAGGVFVSGGSQANLTAILTARDSRLVFEERGKAVVYVSEQTHSSLGKGLGLRGFIRNRSEFWNAMKGNP
jgi:L-2,4-diaminobutyrate decarboxylase